MTQLLQYILTGGGVLLGALAAWALQNRRYAKTVEKAKAADASAEALKVERTRRVEGETETARQLEFDWEVAKKEAQNVTDVEAALALGRAARAKLRARR
jgi:hypothetical protein